MNLGTQNKRNVIVAAVLLVIAVGLFLRMVIFPAFAGHSETPRTGAIASLTQTLRKHVQHGHPGEHHLPAIALTPSIDPRLRLDLLKHEQESSYSGNGRNIFAENSEPIPTPVAPGLRGGTKAPAGPTKFGLNQPPPPPPINLKFFGYESKPGEPKRVFLAQGNGNVLLAHEGDIVGQRYKIVHIGPTSVEIEDVLSNNRQSIPLTQG